MSFLTSLNNGGTIMENAKIEMSNHGVKCDNSGCDFVVSFEAFEEYEQFINKPCPKCGENLLTQEDYDMVHTLHKLSSDEKFAEEFNERHAMNTLPKEIADMLAELDDPYAQTTIRVEFSNGVPVMTSSDPKVQNIIDAVDAYIKKQQDSLKQND